MTTAWTWLFTRLHGRPAGVDSSGNRYYRRARNWGPRPEQRWVVYAGAAEASKVPPANQPTRPWQKPHQPNLTGTPAAYRPPGHTLLGGHRAKATGDYEPWVPS
jgi:NADH:ubiquinone oxidoreductase subunit